MRPSVRPRAAGTACFEQREDLGTKEPGLPCPDGRLPGLGFFKRQMLRRGWSSVLGEGDDPRVVGHRYRSQSLGCEECHPHRENPMVLVLWCGADRGRWRGSQNWIWA